MIYWFFSAASLPHLVPKARKNHQSGSSPGSVKSDRSPQDTLLALLAPRWLVHLESNRCLYPNAQRGGAEVDAHLVTIRHQVLEFWPFGNELGFRAGPH